MIGSNNNNKRKTVLYHGDTLSHEEWLARGRDIRRSVRAKFLGKNETTGSGSSSCHLSHASYSKSAGAHHHQKQEKQKRKVEEDGELAFLHDTPTSHSRSLDLLAKELENVNGMLLRQHLKDGNDDRNNNNNNSDDDNAAAMAWDDLDESPVIETAGVASAQVSKDAPTPIFFSPQEKTFYGARVRNNKLKAFGRNQQKQNQISSSSIVSFTVGSDSPQYLGLIEGVCSNGETPCNYYSLADLHPTTGRALELLDVPVQPGVWTAVVHDSSGNMVQQQTSSTVHAQTDWHGKRLRLSHQDHVLPPRNSSNTNSKKRSNNPGYHVARIDPAQNRELSCLKEQLHGGSTVGCARGPVFVASLSIVAFDGFGSKCESGAFAGPLVQTVLAATRLAKSSDSISNLTALSPFSTRAAAAVNVDCVREVTTATVTGSGGVSVPVHVGWTTDDDKKKGGNCYHLLVTTCEESNTVVAVEVIFPRGRWSLGSTAPSPATSSTVLPLTETNLLQHRTAEKRKRHVFTNTGCRENDSCNGGVGLSDSGVAKAKCSVDDGVALEIDNVEMKDSFSGNETAIPSIEQQLLSSAGQPVTAYSKPKTSSASDVASRCTLLANAVHQSPPRAAAAAGDSSKKMSPATVTTTSNKLSREPCLSVAATAEKPFLLDLGGAAYRVTPTPTAGNTATTAATTAARTGVAWAASAAAAAGGTQDGLGRFLFPNPPSSERSDDAAARGRGGAAAGGLHDVVFGSHRDEAQQQQQELDSSAIAAVNNNNLDIPDCVVLLHEEEEETGGSCFREWAFATATFAAFVPVLYSLFGSLVMTYAASASDAADAQLFPTVLIPLFEAPGGFVGIVDIQ